MCNVSCIYHFFKCNFGCPNGGELGIQVSGEYSNDEKKEKILNAVKSMMGNLGQNTVNDATEGIENFSVKVPTDKATFLQLGENFQDALDFVSSKGSYMISGVLMKIILN